VRDSPVRFRRTTLGGSVTRNGSQVVYDAGRKNRLLAILTDKPRPFDRPFDISGRIILFLGALFFRQLKTAFIGGSVKVMF